MNLTERRAEFVYDAARLAAIAAQAPVIPKPYAGVVILFIAIVGILHMLIDGKLPRWLGGRRDR